MQTWQKELSKRITTVEELAKEMNLTKKESTELAKVNGKFKMGITPYYLSLINRNDPNCPIRKQAIPSLQELNIRAEELADPLGDKCNSPVQGIVHRYPDRVLLLPTYQCATYCRHCFRRRSIGQKEQTLSEKELQRALSYIKKTKSIKEVILTGGDPLILPDQYLEKLLKSLKSIEHVLWIRIHSRVFVTLPARITPQLTKILKTAKPLYIVTHVNHPKEITPQFQKAVQRITNAGITMLDQSVLLKGINDDAELLKELFYKLLAVGVKPYYLHQCDLAQGISHFRTSVGKGIKLLRDLRGFMSGLGIPFYMIDTPGGFGKVPVSYNYLKSHKGKKVSLETFQGKIKDYREP